MGNEQLSHEQKPKADQLSPEIGSTAINGSVQSESTPDTTEEPTREIPINEILYEEQPGISTEHPNIFPGEN